MSQTNLLATRTIQQRAKALAMRLGKPDFQLKSKPMHDGSAHVEVNDAYYLIATERGHEVDRRRTNDVDELLYWVMEGLPSSMSWNYELAHRREGEDARRQAFAEQVELLGTLSPDWAARKRREQADILQRHPFRDG